MTKLSISTSDAVAHLRLTNPPQNVIDIPMMEELSSALAKIESDSSIAVVILCGSEKAFSSGVDIAAHTPDKVEQMLGLFHSVIRSVVSSRKVTIAAVQGNCLGGGAELAMVCDMAFTTPNARWGFPEIKLACFPPVACAALAVVVGQKNAADLILTGRQIDGREAHEMGLANDCLNDVEGRAQEYAQSLTHLSPSALAITKKALSAWDVAHFDKALSKAEKLYFEELMKTADAHEGIKAWMEKREAKWKAQ